MSSEWIVDVDDETFDELVLKRSHELLVVVDFWAQWCGPCKLLTPILEKIAEHKAGKVFLAKVDTDRATKAAQTFSIQSIPSIFAFRNGAVVDQFSGVQPEEVVEKFIDRLIPSENDTVVERANEISKEHPDEAELLYRKVLESDAQHEGAVVGLAEVLHMAGDSEQALSLIKPWLPGVGPYADRIAHLEAVLTLHSLEFDQTEEELRNRLSEHPSSPERGKWLLELGRVLASMKRYEESLEVVLESARTNKELARGPAKELMVDIFHAIGVRSSLADDYRAKLTRVLY